MNEVIKRIAVDGVEYDIVANGVTKTSYAELKALRDNAELVPGQWYRITDYEFTTVQSETKSAGHVFDILVLAVDEKTLNHNAFAAHHEGDEYFAHIDLGAWRLLYDLDNDTTKYAWADEANGKGVIYRMVDEKRNDCPYDFKNALFYNSKTIVGVGTTKDKYYYTFSYVVSDVLYDGTVEARVKGCYGNSMGEYRVSGKLTLNKNVWRNSTFGDSCRSNTFGNGCYSNAFGNNCDSNTFGSSCSYNTFGYDCYHNTFGSSCNYNTFGNGCYSNTFGNNCDSNTFGNGVQNRKVDTGKTSITLNDEYYDDGSGQLVPIKHPDLSTQPSILPYKFMGQYVYEILLPIPDMDISSAYYYIDASAIFDKVRNLDNVAVVQAEELLFCSKTVPNYPTIPVFTKRPVALITEEQYAGAAYYKLMVTPLKTDLDQAKIGRVTSAYLRIVYTSMPEDSSYYGDYTY